MPAWAAWIICAAAVVTALGVLWQKVIRPVAHLIVLVPKALAVLQEVSAELETERQELARIVTELRQQPPTEGPSSD